MMIDKVEGLSPPQALKLHLRSFLHLRGMVCHIMKIPGGEVGLVHSPDHVPKCRICQALGIKEIKDYKF